MLLSQLVRIESIITSIFPVIHPLIFCDRTKIKPSYNHLPVVEIGVALNKLKNVIVSAVIKSNYLAFRLASHTNWLFIVQKVSNAARLVLDYECSELGFNSGMLTMVRSLNNLLHTIMICLVIISNMQHQDSLHISGNSKTYNEM